MQYWLYIAIINAVRDFNVASEVGIVRSPLWSVAEVIVGSLMAEEHALVAPVRGHQLRLSDDRSNELLFAIRRLLRVHVVQLCAYFNRLNLLKQVKVHEVLGELAGEANVALWFISE